ncbi:flagellar hook protein FlgE [Pseudomonas profundi]|uniref:flagellar hook protein FlgE n=1 Tax=Pseudomonas profundi TaxID=1981513 RepID=UPI0012384751|nr:flagellar hook protein FlgE [Pseudomonas profundi]
MSLNIALSGLNAVSDQLGTISNNIANAGTTGFKSSRTDFGSVYSESQALGVEVLGKTQSISQSGSVVATGRTLDLAIAGGGFFMTRSEGNGEVGYTRAGVFNTDKDNFVVSATGQRLQGYSVNAAGALQTGATGDLRLAATNLPASATDSLSFVANLDADGDVPAVGFDPEDAESFNSSYTTKVFDSLGREHTLTQYFVKTDENKWDVRYYADGAEVSAAHAEIEFDAFGALVGPPVAGGATPGVVEFTTGGAAPINLAVDYTGTSQYGSDFVVTANRANGYSAGEQTGLAVERDGKIYATYSNGERRIQGQLVLANFVNAQGLDNKSGTLWAETEASGAALLGIPGVGQNGAISSGSLENSNVDMSEQLVGLMEAQRNYQANTKVLSTDKEINQLLFNAI